MSINSDPARLNWCGQIVQGTLASFLVNGAIHPICTIKTKLMVGTLQSVFSLRSTKGLYNGYFAISATESVTFSLGIGVSDAFKKIGSLASSILAGLISSPFVALGEGIMANMQVNALPYHKIIKKACRANGVLMTAARETPFTVAVFYAAPSVENYVEDFAFAKKYSRSTNIIAGITTSAVAGFLTTPCDLIKTILQTSEEAQTIKNTAQTIISKNGWRALFKGGVSRAFYVGLAGGGMNLVKHTLPQNLPDSFRS